jgi:hypothetical protein
MSMAIEVIEPGHLPEERVYEARCGHCRALLRFKRVDAKFTDDQRDGAFLTVKCPTCGHAVHTAANPMPRPSR